MSAEVFTQLQEQESWEEFKNEIAAFKQWEQSDIEYGYIIAQAAHRTGKPRQTGGRYFNHPRETALILLRAGVRDSDVIVAALLHDVVEDTDFLSPDQEDPTLLYETKQLERWFPRTKIPRMVGNLTQREVGLESKKESDKQYHQQIEGSEEGTILIKIADRIHNLRTMTGLPPEKIARKIEETISAYLVIFSQYLYPYHKEQQLLLTHLDDALYDLGYEKRTFSAAFRYRWESTI